MKIFFYYVLYPFNEFKTHVSHTIHKLLFKYIQRNIIFCIIAMSLKLTLKL